eukprot:354041-Chlamydomonas_euryale.AAC.5
MGVRGREGGKGHAAAAMCVCVWRGWRKQMPPPPCVYVCGGGGGSRCRRRHASIAVLVQCSTAPSRFRHHGIAPARFFVIMASQAPSVGVASQPGSACTAGNSPPFLQMISHGQGIKCGQYKLINRWITYNTGGTLANNHSTPSPQ